MINFDVADFSERRSEEAISFFLTHNVVSPFVIFFVDKT